MYQQLSLFNTTPVIVINVTGIDERINYFEEEQLVNCEFIEGKWYYYESNYYGIKGAFVVNVKLNNENTLIAYEPIKDVVYYPLQFAVREESNDCISNFSYYSSSVISSLGIKIEEEIENYVREEYNKLKLKK